jgi:hypothetical protein
LRSSNGFDGLLRGGQNQDIRKSVDSQRKIGKRQSCKTT